MPPRVGETLALKIGRAEVAVTVVGIDETIDLGILDKVAPDESARHSPRSRCACARRARSQPKRARAACCCAAATWSPAVSSRSVEAADDPARATISCRQDHLDLERGARRSATVTAASSRGSPVCRAAANRRSRWRSNASCSRAATSSTCSTATTCAPDSTATSASRRDGRKENIRRVGRGRGAVRRRRRDRHRRHDLTARRRPRRRRARPPSRAPSTRSTCARASRRARRAT